MTGISKFEGQAKRLVSVLALGTAAVAGGLLRSRYEREHFVTEETVIRTEKVKVPKTLVFLTDLHDKEFGKGNQLLLEAVRQVKPDMVLIGGDTMVTKPGLASLDVTERLLRGLSETGPVYYGNGNHEQRLKTDKKTYGSLYCDFRKLLDRYGVVYLTDSSAGAGEDIRISGLNISKIYYKDFLPGKMESSYIKRHLGEADPARFQILLAHSPLFFDACADWGADLTLAGHFHGGTIRIPGLGGVMTPQYQFFLPCCAGTFEKNKRYMIVGRGLGTHSINIRFCNKPQLVVVRILPEDGWSVKKSVSVPGKRKRQDG